MAKKVNYPHEPRQWTIGHGEKAQTNTYCLADGQVWPCATEQKRVKAASSAR